MNEQLKERARETDMQELACAIKDYVRDRPEEECYEGLKNLLRTFVSRIIAENRQRIGGLELDLKAEKATMAACIATIGGEVEGNPTGRHNFLQRLRELIKLERVATLQRAYLAQSPEDRTAAAAQRITELEQQLAEARAQAFKEAAEIARSHYTDLCAHENRIAKAIERAAQTPPVSQDGVECGEHFIGASDHFAAVCRLPKGHSGWHSSAEPRAGRDLEGK